MQHTTTFQETFAKYSPDAFFLQSLDLSKDYDLMTNGKGSFPNIGIESLYSIGATGHNHLVLIPQQGKSPETYPIAIFDEEEQVCETIASSIKTWFPAYLVYDLDIKLQSYANNIEHGNKICEFEEQEMQLLLEVWNEIVAFVQVFDNPALEAVLPKMLTCIQQRKQKGSMVNWNRNLYYRLAEKDSYLSKFVDWQSSSPKDVRKLQFYCNQYPHYNKGLHTLIDIEVPSKIHTSLAESVFYRNWMLDFGDSSSISIMLRKVAECMLAQSNQTDPSFIALSEAIQQYKCIGEMLFEMAKQKRAKHPQNAMNLAKNAFFMHYLETEEFYTDAFQFISG